MIRYLGGCPCPRCFTTKEQIGALGTKVDDQQRAHLRTHTEHRQHKIDKSRTYMDDNGRGVNSTWLEDLLQADSFIPTRVSASETLNISFAYPSLVERLFIQVVSIWFQLLFHVCPRPASRIRARSLEGHFYPPITSVICSWHR